MNAIRDALQAICERYVGRAGPDVVFPEPYYPYIPDSWNRLLVLAEAQNLASPMDEYVQSLERRSPEERVRRLYIEKGYIPIQPWHDGSLPLALSALFPDEKPNDFGVSNAVPWSLRSPTGANLNPNERLIDQAQQLWAEFLNVIEPRMIIVAGKIPREVLSPLAADRLLYFWSPSPNGIGRYAGTFDTADLLSRYPEVATALEQPGNRRIKSEPRRGIKVFFACHVVSSGRAQLGRLAAR